MCMRVYVCVCGIYIYITKLIENGIKIENLQIEGSLKRGEAKSKTPKV